MKVMYQLISPFDKENSNNGMIHISHVGDVFYSMINSNEGGVQLISKKVINN